MHKNIALAADKAAYLRVAAASKEPLVQRGWPKGNEEFCIKYENLQTCQRKLGGKLKKDHSTFRDQGAVPPMRRPNVSVFDTRASHEAKNQPPQVNRLHCWQSDPQPVLKR